MPRRRDPKATALDMLEEMEELDNADDSRALSMFLDGGAEEDMDVDDLPGEAPPAAAQDGGGEDDGEGDDGTDE